MLNSRFHFGGSNVVIKADKLNMKLVFIETESMYFLELFLKKKIIIYHENQRFSYSEIETSGLGAIKQVP